MSLLLDALKKAAQEKLEKQARERSDFAPAGIPGQPPVQPDTAGRPSAEETPLTVDLTDLDEESGRLNTGQRSGVLANELEFFLDEAATDRYRPGNRQADEAGELSLEPLAEPDESLTGEFRDYDAAAGVFMSKSPPGQRRPLWMIPAILGVAALLILGGWLVYRYLLEPDGRNEPLAPPPVSDAAPGPAAPPQEPRLEIAQEDYSALFGERIADDFESDLKPAAPPPEAAAPSGAEPVREAGPASARQAGKPPAEPAVPGRTRLSIQPSDSRGEPLYQVLMRGYNAYQRGDLGTAEIAYRQALGRAPRNRDALRGLAAVHQLRGDYSAARRYYEKLLELDPRDAAALAGLTALEQAGGGAAPDAQLTALKKLLAEKPDSPHLHFTLGNLYASHRRWPEAQQAYFQAYRLADDNADYAFNLAVSLDRLGQRPAALKFYRRALALSEEHSARFDPAAALRRIEALQDGETG